MDALCAEQDGIRGKNMNNHKYVPNSKSPVVIKIFNNMV